MKKRYLSFIIAAFLAVGYLGSVNATETAALDDNVYNLVTSLIGDASTSRGFAWTAVDGYENMVLRFWVSDENSYTEVAPSKVVDKGTHIYYKTDVLNLTAATEYKYKIGDTVKDEWYGPFSFTTEAETVSDFSFIAVSDPQGSSESDYAYFKLDIDAAMADTPEASFIVNLGDLTNHGYNENQWKWHFDAIEDYCTETPYMGVVGNHDVLNPVDTDYDEKWDAGENFSLHLNHPNNGSNAMAKVSSDDMTSQWFQDIAENLEDTFYSFDYGDAHFAVINTTAETGINGTNGSNLRAIYEVERDWLAEDLAGTDAKWKIVLMHMGEYRADTWRTDIASKEYFGDIIDSNRVDLVLEGHDHIYMRTYPILDGYIRKTSVDLENIDSYFMGTTYSVMGAAANKRYASTSLKGPGEHVYICENTDAAQPTYTVFNISSDKISVVAKQLDGTVLDEYSVVKSDLENIDETIVETGTERVVVKGVAKSEAEITILVTYPGVEKVESFEDIVYLDQLKTNNDGAYYFKFGDRAKGVGEYKIQLNIQGTLDEYGYMHQPQLYVYEGDKKIEKLSDITGNSLDAELEVINFDNGVLYCVQYKEGMPVDVSRVEVEAGPTGEMTISYLGSSKVDEIKLFFWDRISNEPFLHAVIIK